MTSPPLDSPAVTGARAPIRLGWVSAGLLVAAPVLFVVWIVWVSITINVCSMLDARMIGGPTLAFLLAAVGTTASVVMLSRKATGLAGALLTLGVLECVGSGIEVLQASFCIPAPP
jgi:hypothetical protein